MTSSSDQVVEPSASRPSLLARSRHWAALRIVAEAGVVLATVVLVHLAVDKLWPHGATPRPHIVAIALNLFTSGLALGAYMLMVRRLERRPVVELGLRAGAAQLPGGLVIGMAIMAAVYAILWGLHMAAFAPGNGTQGLAFGLVAGIATGVFEELLLRAVLFRILEESFGTTVGMLASAAIFGLLHGGNPGATWWSDAAIALEAGLLLALTYALTRNLWLAIGLHAGWNFAEGNLFGAHVSGEPIMPSLIHSSLTGPDLFTGGVFGPEASVVTIGVCSVVALVFAVVIVRQGGWRPPRFRLSLP